MSSEDVMAILVHPVDEFIAKQIDRVRFTKKLLEHAQKNIEDTKIAHELISIALFTLKQVYDDLTLLEVK